MIVGIEADSKVVSPAPVTMVHPIIRVTKYFKSSYCMFAYVVRLSV